MAGFYLLWGPAAMLMAGAIVPRGHGPVRFPLLRITAALVLSASAAVTQVLLVSSVQP